MTGLVPKTIVTVAALVGLALFLAAAPGPAGEAARAGAVAVVSISLWATGLVGMGLTALVFFFLAMMSGMPVETVFSGFGASAFWLVLGGIVIGVAVQHTGLGDRIVALVVHKLPPSYPLVLVGIVVAATALAFVMPSSLTRALLLMPIVGAMADQFGFPPGSSGRNGLVMTTAFASIAPASGILPALVPSLILAGAAETVQGVTMSWASFFFYNAPVGGLVRGILIVVLILKLFPAEVSGRVSVAPTAGAKGREMLLGGVLSVALALWCTDWLHGISPGWIALGAAVVCLWPGLDLVPARALNERLDVSSLFYVAGVLGVGGIVSQSGLADVLAGVVLDVVPLGVGALVDVMTLHLLGMALAMLLTSPALPAVLTPLADTFADATGLPLYTVLMTQVIGYSNAFLPYQVAPVAVCVQMGGLAFGTAARATLAFSGLAIVVVVPLTALWWWAIGAL